MDGVVYALTVIAMIPICAFFFKKMSNKGFDDTCEMVIALIVLVALAGGGPITLPASLIGISVYYLSKYDFKFKVNKNE